MKKWLETRQVRNHRRQLVEDCNEEIWELGLAVDDLRLRSYHPTEMASPYKVYCADWDEGDTPRCGIKLRANTLADVIAIARNHDCALVFRYYKDPEIGPEIFDFEADGRIRWPV